MSEPLLYLPGLDGTGRLLHQQPRLHELFDVRCASYPHQPAQTYEELAETAAAFLDRPGVVLAESFGGAVALTLALRHPERVSRLVLVNTFAHFPRRILVRLGAALSRFLPSRPSYPAMRGLRGLLFFTPEVSAADRAAFWDRTADVPMNALGWRIRLLAGLDLRPRLREINIPTLVIASPNDRVVPPAAGRLLARILPVARCLELPVGHAALIHPRIDIAALLGDPAYWTAARTPTTKGRSIPG